MTAQAATAENFGHLLDKRIIVVTGKGGVGKTTVASALALRCANLGLRTLLMGIDTSAQIRHFFQVGSASLSEPVEYRPNLYLMELDRQQILDDFIRQTLKLKAFYDPVLRSPIYQYFTAVAPGFRELMTLSRVARYEEARDKRKKTPLYDILIIDAPATGHGISFLDVPRSIVTMFSMGPFVKEAKLLHELLTDHARSTVLMVTLAEEMPANEAAEMYAKLTSDLKMNVAGLVINNLYPPLFETPEEQERLAPLLASPEVGTRLEQVATTAAQREAVPHLLQAARFQMSRRALNDRYVSVIRESIRVPILEVDYMPESIDDLAFLESIGLEFVL